MVDEGWGKEATEDRGRKGAAVAEIDPTRGSGLNVCVETGFAH